MSQAQCVIIIFFENNAVALAEKLRNKKEKIEKAKLSNIEITLSIVITLNIITQHCNSTL